jgi:putative transposase
MSQSLAQIYVHIIFSTKNGFNFLTDPALRSSVHAYLAKIFNCCHTPAIEVGGATDHIHALCSLGRSNSVADLTRDVRANSTSWIKLQGGSLSKFEWQRGYGAFSVSPGEIKQVREYIRGQMEHHRFRSFQEEFLEFLRIYNVPYDERYIWS